MTSEIALFIEERAALEDAREHEADYEGTRGKGKYLRSLAQEIRDEFAGRTISDITTEGPGSHRADLAEMRAQAARADKAERERDEAQEQAAYWQRTANEFEQESIRDLAQREAALHRVARKIPRGSGAGGQTLTTATCFICERERSAPSTAFDPVCADCRAGRFDGAPAQTATAAKLADTGRHKDGSHCHDKGQCRRAHLYAHAAPPSITARPLSRTVRREVVIEDDDGNSSNHEDADVCRCGSLMHRDGECDAAERVIVSARRVMELLGTRDGQSFMHRDAALHGHWKELRAAIVALDAAREKV